VSFIKGARRVNTRATLLLTGLVVSGATRDARAQTMASCPQLAADIHKALDCIEGVFSEPPVHLTVSSIPPGNGFPIGVVYEDAVHHLGGFTSLTKPSLSYTRSTNGSWDAAGSLIWLPPLPYRDSIRKGQACYRLGAICTMDVFSLSVSAEHRTLNTLAFYGLGGSSLGTKFTYQELETYGGVSARMPITNWLRIDGGIEARRASLPTGTAPDSVSANFDESTAPGLRSQPGFLHSSLALRTDAMHIAERASTGETTLPSANEDQVVLKSRTVFRFQNNIAYHWYGDRDTGHYSFQQFGYDGDESIQFGAVLQQFVKPGSSWLVSHLCEGNKRDSTCDFGTIDIKSLVSLANVNLGNAMPFYLQPTIGGSDIESRESLRGFDDYRFRGADVAFVQVEFSRTLADPLGVFLFVDAGLIGTSASSLWSAPVRTDGGIGLSVRLQGRVVLEVFAAVGGGAGVTFGKNFEKLF
jgi:hypothetical protein